MQFTHDPRSLSPITELTTPGSLRTIGLPFDLNPSYESEHEVDSRSPSPAGSAQTIGSGETVTQGVGLHLQGLDPPSSPGDDTPAAQAFDIGRQPSVEPPSLYATPETSPQHTSTISFPKVIIEAIGPYHPSAPAIRPGGLPPPLRPTSGSIKHFTPPPSPNLNPSDEARQRYNDRYGISPGLSAVGAPGDSPSTPERTPERHTGHLEPEPNSGLAGVGAGGSRPGSRPGSVRSRPSSFHARPVVVNRSLSDLALPDLAFVDPILHGGSMPALISAQEDHTLHGIPFLSDESTAEVWQKVNSSRSSLDKGSYSPNGSRVSLERAAGRSSPRTSRISIGKRSPTKLSVVSLSRPSSPVSRPDVRARSRSYQGSREAGPKVRPSTYHGGTGTPVTTSDSPLNLHAESSPIPIPPGRPRVSLRRSDPDLSGLLLFSPSSPSSPSLHRRKTPPRRRTVSSVFSRIFGADPSKSIITDQRTPAGAPAHRRKLSKKDRRSGNRTDETVYPLTPPIPTDVDGVGGLGGGELEIPVTAIRTSGTFGIRDDGSEVFIHDNANQSPITSPRGLTHRSRTKSGTGSAKRVGINRVLYVKNMDEPVLEDDESVALPPPPQDQVAVELTSMASSTGSREGETFYTPVGIGSPAISDTPKTSTPDPTTGLPTQTISSFDGALIASAFGGAIGDDEADFGTIKSVHHIRQRSHSHPTVSSALFVPLGAPIPSIQAQRPGTPPPSHGRRGTASSTASQGKRSDSINSASSRTRGHSTGVPPSSDLGPPTQPSVQVSPTHLLPETTPHGPMRALTPPGSATSARHRPLPRPPSSASRPASVAHSSTDAHHSTGHQDASGRRDLSQYDGPRLHLPPPPEHDPSQSSGLGALNGAARHDEQPAPHPPHHTGMPRQEGQEAKGKRASGTIAPELPALIASHLLSAQAVALMKHSTAMREASEAMSQMAKESLDWGGILLNMAKEESPHSHLNPDDGRDAGGHTQSPGTANNRYARQRTAAEEFDGLDVNLPTSERGGAREDHIDGLPAGAYLPHLPRFIPSQGPPGFSDAPPAKDQLSTHYRYSQGIASDRGHPSNDLYPTANSPDVSPSSSTPPHPYARRAVSWADDGDRLTPIPARPSFTRSQTRLSAKTASTETFAKGHGHDTGRRTSVPEPLPLRKTYELLRHAENLGAEGWEGIREAELAWREAVQAMRSALGEADTRRRIETQLASPSYHGDAVKGPSDEIKQRVPPYDQVPHSFLPRREDMRDSTDGARLRSTGDPGKAQWILGPHSGIPHSSVPNHPSADVREVNFGYTDLHLGLDPVFKVPPKHASQLDKTQHIGLQGSYDSFTSYPASQISGRDSRGRAESKKLSKSRLGRDAQGSSVPSRRKRVDEVKRVPSPRIASKRGSVASRDGGQGGDTGNRQQGRPGKVKEKVKVFESEYEHQQGLGGSTFRKKHWWSRRVTAAE